MTLWSAMLNVLNETTCGGLRLHVGYFRSLFEAAFTAAGPMCLPAMSVPSCCDDLGSAALLFVSLFVPKYWKWTLSKNTVGWIKPSCSIRARADLPVDVLTCSSRDDKNFGFGFFHRVVQTLLTNPFLCEIWIYDLYLTYQYWVTQMHQSKSIKSTAVH